MTAPLLDTVQGKDAEITEAVIISGPRRGQIIQLYDDGTSAMQASENPFMPEEWALLDAALDTLLTSVNRLEYEMKETTAAFKKSNLP